MLIEINDKVTGLLFSAESIIKESYHISGGKFRYEITLDLGIYINGETYDYKARKTDVSENLANIYREYLKNKNYGFIFSKKENFYIWKPYPTLAGNIFVHEYKYANKTN